MGPRKNWLEGIVSGAKQKFHSVMDSLDGVRRYPDVSKDPTSDYSKMLRKVKSRQPAADPKTLRPQSAGPGSIESDVMDMQDKKMKLFNQLKAK